MKQLLILSVLLASPFAAQEPKKAEEPSPKVHKVFILKYADPSQMAKLLGVFGAALSQNAELHALAVTSSPDLMPAIEEAIKRLDVPTAATPNIELTAYYLIGGDGENPPGGGPVPNELDSVIKQLKNAFAFKVYHLLDVLALRTRAGQNAGTTSNTGPLGPGLPGAINSFTLRAATLSADGATVRLDNVKAGIRMPVLSGPAGSTLYQYVDLGLNADVDIKEGQKVVVGRLSVNKDQALFLVLTAHVVN